MPFAIELLGFEDGEFPVEEDIETAYTGVEQFGEEQMPQLVGDYEERQTDEEYNGFHTVRIP